MHAMPQAGPAADALAAHVRAETLELADPQFAPIAGTIQVDPARSGGEHDLSGLAGASIDAIVCQRLSWPLRDPIRAIEDWKRVMRPGGPLALVVEGEQAPDPMVDMLHRVGGFELQSVQPLEDGSGFCVVAERSIVAELRGPLATIAPGLAQCVNDNESVRAEMYFQLGSMLLQAGDAELSGSCFDAMLQLEPQSSHARFGLGMCHATVGRWDDALSELQRAIALEPGDTEVERWIELARERSSMTDAAEPPAAEPAVDTDQLAGLPTMDLVDRLAAMADDLSRSAEAAVRASEPAPSSQPV